jgi:hypothetical protein
MSERVYTLELTADELESYLHGTERKGREAVYGGLKKLYEQACADRERDDLRLPWRIERSCSLPDAAFERVRFGDGLAVSAPSERAAKLMSAAPELLEAVQAVKRWIAAGQMLRQLHSLVEVLDRALRKVETGIPEGEP